MLINAMDYPDLNEAIVAAEPGDRIYVPGVRRWVAPGPSGFVITKSLEIFGDGPGTPGQEDGTTFVPSTSDVFTITSEIGDIGSVHLHDFKIKNTGANDGANGIRCVTPEFSIDSLRLERVTVLSLKNNGFLIDVTDLRLRSFEMTSCLAIDNDGLGLFLKNVKHARLVNSFFSSNKLGGVYSEGNCVAIYAAGMEQNASDLAAIQGQLEIRSCPIARLDACHFELFAQGPDGGSARSVACDIVDGGGAIVIGGCYFTLGNASTFGASVRMQAGVEGPVTLLPNRHTRVKTLSKVVSSSTTGVLLPQFDDGANGTSMGNVGDIEVPASPLGGMIGCPSLRRVGVEPVSIRELRGLLVPSGAGPPTTNVQDGMLFYDTTTPPGLLVRVGGAWKRINTI